MINQKSPNNTQATGNRRKWATILILMGILLASVFISSMFVTVSETESVIVERLGKIVAIYDQPGHKGIHWKFPWPLETVRKFDQRIQIYDPPGREFFTQDKKNIIVDTYLCWKIAQPSDPSSLKERPVLKFFRSLGDPEIAEARLDSRLRSIFSTQLGKLKLTDILDVKNSETGPEILSKTQIDKISESILKQLNQQKNETDSLISRLGIDIVDVRIKRINLPYGNLQSVYERMKSERKKIADRYRSAGQAENQMIRSQADRHYSEFIAKANTEAARIKAEAEAKSVQIVNESHARDPEFYQFLQTLDSYEKILNEKTSLILSLKNPLMKLFADGISLKKTDTPSDKTKTSEKKESKKTNSIPKEKQTNPDNKNVDEGNS
jgi:modulator of FtsH protease HflC